MSVRHLFRRGLGENRGNFPLDCVGIFDIGKPHLGLIKEAGGSVIDSSPMYGLAKGVVGD
jgi:hypothetical protein